MGPILPLSTLVAYTPVVIVVSHEYQERTFADWMTVVLEDISTRFLPCSMKKQDQTAAQFGPQSIYRLKQRGKAFSFQVR